MRADVAEGVVTCMKCGGRHFYVQIYGDDAFRIYCASCDQVALCDSKPPKREGLLNIATPQPKPLKMKTQKMNNVPGSVGYEPPCHHCNETKYLCRFPTSPCDCKCHDDER